MRNDFTKQEHVEYLLLIGVSIIYNKRDSTSPILVKWRKRTHQIFKMRKTMKKLMTKYINFSSDTVCDYILGHNEVI